MATPHPHPRHALTTQRNWCSLAPLPSLQMSAGCSALLSQSLALTGSMQMVSGPCNAQAAFVGSDSVSGLALPQLNRLHCLAMRNPLQPLPHTILHL